MMYPSCSCGKLAEAGPLVDAFHEALKILPRELPLGGTGNLFIVVLEAQDSLLEFLKGSEVVGSEDLALEDREVDLDLVEPTGMYGCVYQHEVGPSALETLDAGLAPMRGAVVHDPEHARSRLIRLAGHDLEDQAVEGLYAGFGFATPEAPGLFDVPGGDVGQSSHAGVLMFDPGGHTRSGWPSRMATAPRLDAGLFIGDDDPFVRPQGLAVPEALVQIKDAACLGFEVGITREDPTAVAPRLDGVLAQPPPDGGLSDGSHNASVHGGSLQLGHAEAGQRDSVLVGQLTCHRFDGDGGCGGKTSPGGRGEERHRARRDVPRRSACATC